MSLPDLRILSSREIVSALPKSASLGSFHPIEVPRTFSLLDTSLRVRDFPPQPSDEVGLDLHLSLSPLGDEISADVLNSHFLEADLSKNIVSNLAEGVRRTNSLEFVKPFIASPPPPSLARLHRQISDSLDSTKSPSVKFSRVRFLLARGISHFQKFLRFLLSTLNLKYALLSIYSVSRAALDRTIQWMHDNVIFRKISIFLRSFLRWIDLVTDRISDMLKNSIKFLLSRSPAVRLVMFLIAVFLLIFFWESLVAAIIAIFSSVIFTVLSGLTSVIPNLISSFLKLF